MFLDRHGFTRQHRLADKKIFGSNQAYMNRAIPWASNLRGLAKSSASSTRSKGIVVWDRSYRRFCTRSCLATSSLSPVRIFRSTPLRTQSSQRFGNRLFRRIKESDKAREHQFRLVFGSVLVVGLAYANIAAGLMFYRIALLSFLITRLNTPANQWANGMVKTNTVPGTSAATNMGAWASWKARLVPEKNDRPAELIALCFCLAGRDFRESQLPFAGPSICRGAKPFGTSMPRRRNRAGRYRLYQVDRHVQRHSQLRRDRQ
jgi:hypothetical protein